MTAPQEHDAAECCGVPTVGEILAELAAERAERVAGRRAWSAHHRAQLGERRAAGLVLRQAQRLARLRDTT